jgi:CheY-like chemotaxis protein
MEVRDSGSGMTEEVKARIFDPFFTTKFSGRGLGLAAVSGIIRGHNGRMELESSPGQGTTFKIFLPAVDPVLISEEVAATDCIQGSGTILVVDDEPVLRELVKTELERRGYSVLVAENGRDAVSVLREKVSEITAVVLDLTMPVMGGEEAFRQIREIRPELPILISSGYGEFFAREQFGVADSLSFIQKPYTPTKLADKLSQSILRTPHN